MASTAHDVFFDLHPIDRFLFALGFVGLGLVGGLAAALWRQNSPLVGCAVFGFALVLFRFGVAGAARVALDVVHRSSAPYQSSSWVGHLVAPAGISVVIALTLLMFYVTNTVVAEPSLRTWSMVVVGASYLSIASVFLFTRSSRR